MSDQPGYCARLLLSGNGPLARHITGYQERPPGHRRIATRALVRDLTGICWDIAQLESERTA